MWPRIRHLEIWTPFGPDYSSMIHSVVSVKTPNTTWKSYRMSLVSSSSVSWSSHSTFLQPQTWTSYSFQQKDCFHFHRAKFKPTVWTPSASHLLAHRVKSNATASPFPSVVYTVCASSTPFRTEQLYLPQIALSCQTLLGFASAEESRFAQEHDLFAGQLASNEWLGGGRV